MLCHMETVGPFAGLEHLACRLRTTRRMRQLVKRAGLRAGRAVRLSSTVLTEESVTATVMATTRSRLAAEWAKPTPRLPIGDGAFSQSIKYPMVARKKASSSSTSLVSALGSCWVFCASRESWASRNSLKAGIGEPSATSRSFCLRSASSLIVSRSAPAGTSVSTSVLEEGWHGAASLLDPEAGEDGAQRVEVLCGRKPPRAAARFTGVEDADIFGAPDLAELRPDGFLQGVCN